MWSESSDFDNDAPHVPVLVEEVISNLLNEETEIFVDATIGCGGHTKEVLRRFKKVKVIGLDVDEEAIQIAKKRLEEFEGRVTILKGNYRNIERVLDDLKVREVDAILFDLGISSFQLNSRRGFSFHDDDFLDMRMDKERDLTAFQVVNRYPMWRLAQIIRSYGDEKEASRIARAIVLRRKLKEIRTAKELAEIIEKAKRRRGKIHPATLTFQALRMEVNEEMENLKEGLIGATRVLRKGGRIGVISFHSIEDRAVKNLFRAETCLRVLTKKPIKPKREEVLKNPRSRSAKLRVAEKI